MLQAYRQAQTTTETARETEYRLFAEVTRSLISASTRQERDIEFFKAIDWNRRLWTTLSNDCAIPGNGLPKELRAQIISIGIWVSKYSSEVARGKADMDALIDVNRSIMEGLTTTAS